MKAAAAKTSRTKSCLNCRKSKQRCDIPDRAAVRPSMIPQPLNLACHRCKVLSLDCVIDIPLLPKVEKGEKQDQQRLKYHHHPYTQHSQQQYRWSASPLRTIIKAESSPYSKSPSSSNDHHRSRKPASYHASASTSITKDSAHREVQIFDPHFQEYYGNEQLPDGKSTEYSSRGIDSSFHPESSSSSSDIGEKLKSFRPFPYLNRLCSAQPDFLAPSYGNQAHSLSLEAIYEKHAPLIRWPEMNMHLREYELFLPFLEPFNEKDPIPARAGLYLAFSLYLAAIRTDLEELQIDLLIFIRQQTLSCMIRGPSNAGEAATFVALALYEPLLLVNSVEEIQLDGAGFLAAACTASITLDLERMPSMMRSFDLHSNRDPTGILRQCSLWLTIAFYSGFTTLASNLRQRPHLECTIQDLNDVELFCKRSLEVPGASRWSDQVSLLLTLIFRYRTLRDFQEITVRQLSILEGIPLVPYDQAEACLGEGVTRSFACATDVLNRLQALRHRLSLPEASGDLFIDYLELETEQLHLLCILNLSEACCLRIASHYGRPLSLHTWVKRLMRDVRSLKFTAIVGIPKCEIISKLSTLFSNFASRWCDNRQEQQRHIRLGGSGVVSLALPPGYLCAMALLNIKCLADHVGGKFQLGENPRNCLDDREVGLAVQLCRGHADSLRCISELQSDQLFQAKGHRDLFRMTSGIASRTSSAIYKWAATSKGLRRKDIPIPRAIIPSNHHHHHNNNVPGGAPLSSSFAPAAIRAAASSSSSPVITKATSSFEEINDFDRLLDEILSTPILYT